MAKRTYRSSMEFQREAEQVLKRVTNLHFVYNTCTFIMCWLTFVGITTLSRWIPTPFNWLTIVIVLVFTVMRTYPYLPATSDYLRNVPHLRRLTDEAQQNFTRDGIVPKRMK